MDNGVMEILVQVQGESAPRSVKFEDLFAIKEVVLSIVLMWTYNSYYVGVDKSTFLINGGRKLKFDRIKNPKLVYRKRTSQTISTTGAAEGERRSMSWIVGIQEGDDGEMILLNITETGANWHWMNTL